VSEWRRGLVGWLVDWLVDAKLASTRAGTSIKMVPQPRNRPLWGMREERRGEESEAGGERRWSAGEKKKRILGMGNCRCCLVFGRFADKFPWGGAGTGGRKGVQITMRRFPHFLITVGGFVVFLRLILVRWGGAEAWTPCFTKRGGIKKGGTIPSFTKKDEGDSASRNRFPSLLFMVRL